MRRVALWSVGIILAVTAVWMIDLAATVRFKVAILKLLPLDAETLDSSIRKLCAGAHLQTAAMCYLSFYSEEASDEVARRQKCAYFTSRLAAGEEKDWIAASSNQYIYIGSDPAYLKMGGGLSFLSKECYFFSLHKNQGFTFK